MAPLTERETERESERRTSSLTIRGPALQEARRASRSSRRRCGHKASHSSSPSPSAGPAKFLARGRRARPCALGRTHALARGEMPGEKRGPCDRPKAFDKRATTRPSSEQLFAASSCSRFWIKFARCGPGQCVGTRRGELSFALVPKLRVSSHHDVKPDRNRLIFFHSISEHRRSVVEDARE